MHQHPEETTPVYRVFFPLKNHICLNLFSSQVADGNNVGAIKFFQRASLSICWSVCSLSLQAFELISSAFNIELETLKLRGANERGDAAEQSVSSLIESLRNRHGIEMQETGYIIQRNNLFTYNLMAL